MEPSPIEGYGEVDVGKGVPNHYKFGFCFLYPYFYIYILLLIEKFLRKPIPPLPSWLGC